MNPHQERATGLGLLLAFAAVYVFWGSTYLAIRVAIETIPPFVMLCGRFLIAGSLLYAFTRLKGHARATRAEWGTAAVTGLLTLGGGNGAVVWAEQRVPSGIAAVLAAVVALWMVLFEWMLPDGKRPRAVVMVGLAIGMAGVVLLVGPGHEQVSISGALVLVFGSASWAAGSIFNKHGGHPASAQMSTALQMLSAGAAFTILAFASGEMARFHATEVSTRSLISLAYLIVFGSLVGFTAYIYIMRSTTAARASTYAYVNPVVALFLGWLLLGEPITAQTLGAAAVILAGVALIVRGGAQGAADAGDLPAAVREDAA